MSAGSGELGPGPSVGASHGALVQTKLFGCKLEESDLRTSSINHFIGGAQSSPCA